MEGKKRSSGKNALSKAAQTKAALNNLLKVTATTENISTWDRYRCIGDIISVLSKLQSPSPPKKPNSQQNKRTELLDRRRENIKYFLDWLKENEVDTTGIEICEFPGYELGLKATKKIEAGSLLLNIPRKLILTEDSAKVSKYGQVYSKEISDQFIPHTLLALHVLLIKYTADPFWKPYIDIFPSKYNTILYFSQEEMLALEGSPAFNSSLQFCINIVTQYAYLHSLFEKNNDPMSNIMKKNFTYNDYRWAVSTIMTRLNSIPSESDPENKINALIPLWDMCNHCSGQITTNFDLERNQLECFSLKDYNEGDQIFIFYGIRSNRYFFQYNGFVYPENEHDTYPVTLGISPHDPLHDDKVSLLEKLGLNKRQECIIENKENPISPSFLAFARVFVMNKDEICEWLKGNNHGDLIADEIPDNPNFANLTKRAFGFINTRCSLLKGAYNAKEASKLIENLTITKDDTEKPNSVNKNEQHCNMIKMLKQCEANLLQKAVDFTKGKM